MATGVIRVILPTRKMRGRQVNGNSVPRQLHKFREHLAHPVSGNVSPGAARPGGNGQSLTHTLGSWLSGHCSSQHTTPARRDLCQQSEQNQKASSTHEPQICPSVQQSAPSDPQVSACLGFGGHWVQGKRGQKLSQASS